MSRPSQALLELLRSDVESRCEAILEAARKTERATLRRARREARARVAAAIREERGRAAQAVRGARARLETIGRERRQAHARALLDRGREALAAAVLARWGEPRARAEWCAALLARAAGVLEGDTWQIEHPPGWDRGELDAAAAPPAVTLRFAPVEELAAGLRVRAGGACLDGTPRGLLADRAGVEGKLLAAYDRAAEQEGGAAPEAEEGT